jgi:hypothetical protein
MKPGLDKATAGAADGAAGSKSIAAKEKRLLVISASSVAVATIEVEGSNPH